MGNQWSDRSMDYDGLAFLRRMIASYRVELLVVANGSHEAEDIAVEAFGDLVAGDYNVMLTREDEMQDGQVFLAVLCDLETDVDVIRNSVENVSTVTFLGSTSPQIVTEEVPPPPQWLLDLAKGKV